jgi:hypothetical protein
MKIIFGIVTALSFSKHIILKTGCFPSLHIRMMETDTVSETLCLRTQDNGTCPKQFSCLLVYDSLCCYESMLNLATVNLFLTGLNISTEPIQTIQ